MNRLSIFILAILLLSYPFLSIAQEKPTSWEVYFSPHGGCTESIIRELNQAKSTVLVQAYSFTSAPIAKALLGAHKRGVKVEVILDKSQRTQQYSSATFFYNTDIPVKIDFQHAIAHNKVMIIDGETLITGSFNFTKATVTATFSELRKEKLIITKRGIGSFVAWRRKYEKRNS